MRTDHPFQMRHPGGRRAGSRCSRRPMIINCVTFNQWVNREPRFYVGVTYDSSLWLNQTGFTQANPLVTTLKKDGNSGLKSYDSPPTGMGVRKNVVAGAKWNDNGRATLLLRLGNILLG